VFKKEWFISSVTIFVFIACIGIAQMLFDQSEASVALSEEEYREKIDELFFQLEKDITKFSEESTNADTVSGEITAVMEMSEAISKSMSDLREIQSPDLYSEEHVIIQEMLLDVYSNASKTLSAYEEGSKAYNSIQEIIDSFADAYRYKNEVFGYK
jgi:uncharacterized membrane-anchored protein YjiN (DUF445 family)